MCCVTRNFGCKGQTGHFQLPKGGWRTCRTRRADGVLCESAAGFSDNIGYQDEGYFDALVHMFEQALKVTCQLLKQPRCLDRRLDRVRTISHNLGYGVATTWTTCLQI